MKKENSKYPVHVRDLNTRDICIVPVKEEQTYYLIDCKPRKGQNPGKRCVNIRESKDLTWWSESELLFEPDDDFWGPLDFWAPEVHYYKGKYYLVSSFRHPKGHRGCQFLVADNIKGPYKPMVNHAATPENWHCLDGTLYVDKKGQPWMVFCHEWTQVQDGQMCAIRMKDDLSDSIGEPIILFRASEAPWKFTDDRALWEFSEPQYNLGWARITDGCYMYRAKNGELLMTWTSYSNTAYTTGYARSASGEIEGPWIQEAEPLFSQDGGHAMFFERFDGTLMMVLHSPNRFGKEHMLLFEMEDKDGKLNIINELTGNFLWMYEARDEKFLNAIEEEKKAKEE